MTSSLLDLIKKSANYPKRLIQDGSERNWPHVFTSTWQSSGCFALTRCHFSFQINLSFECLWEMHPISKCIIIFVILNHYVVFVDLQGWTSIANGNIFRRSFGLSSTMCRYSEDPSGNVTNEVSNQMDVLIRWMIVKDFFR